MWTALEHVDLTDEGTEPFDFAIRRSYWSSKEYYKEARRQRLYLSCAKCGKAYLFSSERNRSDKHICKCGFQLEIKQYEQMCDYIPQPVRINLTDTFSEIINIILSFPISTLSLEEKEYCINAIKDRKDIKKYIVSTGVTRWKAGQIVKKLQYLLKPYAGDFLYML
jgi:hypothetical protein